MATHFLRTSDIAKALGVHANTIRNYEAWGYLPQVARGENGYRLYTAVHLQQAHLIALTLQWPFLGDKNHLIDLVKSAANNNLGTALELAYDYLARIQTASITAEIALKYMETWAAGQTIDSSPHKLLIGQTAQYLNLTVDSLRNWERNGLIHIPRDPTNGYRLYRAPEFARLRVISQLLQSGFSLMAIARLLQQIDAGQGHNLRAALELAPEDSANEAILILGDRWLANLATLEKQAQTIIRHLVQMLNPTHSA